MSKKDQPEKPTPEQLKKLKTSPKPEKKENWPYEIEPEKKEDSLNGSQAPTEENQKERNDSFGLEEICGNLWVVLYQLGGVLKKGFEPLTNDVKNLLAPPTARCAIRHHVQDYMKDEFLILGILGIDITKRLMVKKKDDKNDYRETGKGKDNADSQPDTH